MKPVRIQHQRASEQMINADHVARAIVTASKLVGVDPVDVLTGKLDQRAYVPRTLGHARAYAAVALRRTFPWVKKNVIGAMVGSGSPSVFMAQLEKSRRAETLKWWEDWIIEAVVNAVNGVPYVAPAPAPAVADPEPVIEMPQFLQPRPKWGGKVSRSAKPGKQQLYEMLRQAVLNTAAMEGE